MTPRIDRCCVEFLKRVPDQFRTAFSPGTGQALPHGHMIKAENIIDYVNRGMQDLFNQFWQMAAGDVKKFIGLFPELVSPLSAAVTLTGGNYTIASPYLNFYKLIGAVKSSDNAFIKVKDEYLYTVYLSQKYDDLTPTEDNPAIIQIGQMLAVFPQTLSGQIKFHYIKAPILSTTGGFLIQNGSEDSPFFDHWNKQIVDNAYLKYLEETNQTT